MVTAVPIYRSSCYCFVEDILWPAVSARGLHALLASKMRPDLTGQITVQFE